ncbi:hypothetical protein [Limnohabitans sp. MMS-10A-178]|uniref:hypothetical protein n=1 Tax=Limnohabitans sp. MMS-10A-178 TaxID=1835767 RepID=UPI0018EE8918|nr:hypothetical protein [Limnohabitans sp. MMS-10A-178]
MKFHDAMFTAVVYCHCPSSHTKRLRSCKHNAEGMGISMGMGMGMGKLKIKKFRPVPVE